MYPGEEGVAPLPKVKDAIELSVAFMAQCTVSATDRIGGGTRDAQGWEGLGSKQTLPMQLPKLSQYRCHVTKVLLSLLNLLFI